MYYLGSRSPHGNWKILGKWAAHCNIQIECGTVVWMYHTCTVARVKLVGRGCGVEHLLGIKGPHCKCRTIKLVGRVSNFRPLWALHLPIQLLISTTSLQHKADSRKSSVKCQRRNVISVICHYNSVDNWSI